MSSFCNNSREQRMYVLVGSLSWKREICPGLSILCVNFSFGRIPQPFVRFSLYCQRTYTFLFILRGVARLRDAMGGPCALRLFAASCPTDFNCRPANIKF